MVGRKKSPIKLGEDVEEYLKLKSQSTAEIYRTGFRKFITYYRGRYGEDVDYNHFLETLFDNSQLLPQERKRVGELEMVEYLNFLKDEGVSNNTQRLYFSAIQNYLKYRGIILSAKWVGNYPRATGRKENKKHPWKLSQIKEFVQKADSYRDKAIILTLFQSGISISDLRELNYDDVKYDLENGVLPLLLDLSRHKTGVVHTTFLGADAIKYLKIYLEARGDLKPDSPLFVVERQRGKTARITDGAIQKKFKAIAENLSFLKNNGDGYNPARPHSMRSAFRSRLTGKMDVDLIEFFMGHTLPGSKVAYINLPEEELRELYAQFEHQLSIETTSQKVNAGLDRQTSDIDEKYRKRVEDLETTLRTQASQLSQLSELNSRLSYEVGELREERGAEIMGLGEEAQETLMEFVNLLKQSEIREKFLAFLQELTQGAA